MKPGDLRRFKDGFLKRLAGDHFVGSTFMVLRVSSTTPEVGERCVDILLDDMIEEGLGYFWVEDSSVVIDGPASIPQGTKRQAHPSEVGPCVDGHRPLG